MAGLEKEGKIGKLTLFEVFKLEFAINFAICNQTKSKCEGFYSSYSRNE